MSEPFSNEGYDRVPDLIDKGVIAERFTYAVMLRAWQGVLAGSIPEEHLPDYREMCVTFGADGILAGIEARAKGDAEDLHALPVIEVEQSI